MDGAGYSRRMTRCANFVDGSMNGVLLALRDGHRAARYGAELEATGEWTLLPAARSNTGARAVLAQHEAVLLVTELELIDGSTTDLLRGLQRRPGGHRVNVLVSSCHAAENPLVLDALHAGADSFVDLSDAPAGTLAASARATLAGRGQIAPWVGRRLLAHFGHSDPQRQQAVEELSSPLALNADERSLLQRLADGQPLDELALGDGVTARMVLGRLRAVCRKTQWLLRAGDLTLA